MTRHTDRRIDRVIAGLEIAARAKPAYDQDIFNDLAYPDDRPRENETGIVAKGGTSDPTGEAATNPTRFAAFERSNRVEVMMLRLESLTKELVREVNRGSSKTPAAQNEPLCAGGDPSTWGDPTCGEIVRSEERAYGTWYHPSELCDRHLKAKQRHERRSAA